MKDKSLLIYMKFIRFLKENNCYYEFIMNRHINMHLNNKYNSLIENEKKYNFISSAFIWGSTIEGNDFWSNIHNKWIKQYNI